MTTPERTIERLSLYRRLLGNALAGGAQNVFSHQLASMAGVTAAQVRRDFMSIGYMGNPRHGYSVRELLDSIGHFMDESGPRGVALVGLGNLGRAILAFFHGRRPRLAITAAFDRDPSKVNRVVHGCRCYLMDELAKVASEQGIQIGIIAVPAGDAQAVAEAFTAAGIRGLLNFAPVPLRVGKGVFVEDIDMTMSLEKVAYFSRDMGVERAEAK